ncbi:hypothetical protein B4098_1915 [Heyndrickxia coagulans]|uniref:Uncharacterized protein n=1 Tax=Heyndrickxia coagulans TaxID=1398 RepID=A0A150JVM9_HEYCO|nr:hypothetical protein B4098_1915 [Heyndrickxia coagulans]
MAAVEAAAARVFCGLSEDQPGQGKLAPPLKEYHSYTPYTK